MPTKLTAFPSQRGAQAGHDTPSVALSELFLPVAFYLLEDLFDLSNSLLLDHIFGLWLTQIPLLFSKRVKLL